jgi:hypothetical protein
MIISELLLILLDFSLYTVYTYSFSHLAPGTCYTVPTPAPKWVLAYYLAPIFCDTIHHMIWDWHTGIVQSTVAHPAFVAVSLLHFFENKEKLYCTSDIKSTLIFKINSDGKINGDINIITQKSYQLIKLKKEHYETK